MLKNKEKNEHKNSLKLGYGPLGPSPSRVDTVYKEIFVPVLFSPLSLSMLVGELN
jgi:hypothetical protein